MTVPAVSEPTLGEVYRAVLDLKNSLGEYVLREVYARDIAELRRDIKAAGDERAADKRTTGVWVRWAVGLFGVGTLANVASIFTQYAGK